MFENVVGCSTRSTRPSSTARCPRWPRVSAARASGSARPPPTPIRFCSQLNPRNETIRADLQALKGFNDTYSAAAQDILTTLNAASTTSTTITNHAKQLDALLLATIGLSNSGISLLAPSQANLIKAINVLEPTTNLLYKYNPEYTCLLVGAKTLLDTGGYEAPGGNGRILVLDAGAVARRRPVPLSGQPAGHRRQGRTGRQTGLRLAARCRQELAGAPARHQHRLRHRRGLAAQPRHRLPGLRQLPAGDPRGARAAEHPQPVRRARAGTDPVSGSPGLRRGPMYAPDGTPLWPGLPPAPPPVAPEIRVRRRAPNRSSSLRPRRCSRRRYRRSHCRRRPRHRPDHHCRQPPTKKGNQP